MFIILKTIIFQDLNNAEVFLFFEFLPVLGIFDLGRNQNFKPPDEGSCGFSILKFWGFFPSLIIC